MCKTKIKYILFNVYRRTATIVEFPYNFRYFCLAKLQTHSDSLPRCLLIQPQLKHIQMFWSRKCLYVDTIGLARDDSTKISVFIQQKYV